MTERRFYVRPADAAPGALTLRGDEAHHARRVLRLDVGAAVSCFDGLGSVWRGRIAEYRKEAAVVEPLERVEAPPEPRPLVTLAQGLLKGERMEVVVQKATELGAARVVPLLAARSEGRLDGDRAGRRAERWRRIALEAAKQCERARLPEIAPPATVAAAVAALEGPGVAFVERDGAPARAALGALGRPERLTVFVGPEGGWAPGERLTFEAAGLPRLSLGPNVLRAETAAIAALVVVAYELGG